VWVNSFPFAVHKISIENFNKKMLLKHQSYLSGSKWPIKDRSIWSVADTPKLCKTWDIFEKQFHWVPSEHRMAAADRRLQKKPTNLDSKPACDIGCQWWSRSILWICCLYLCSWLGVCLGTLCFQYWFRRAVATTMWYDGICSCSCCVSVLYVEVYVKHPEEKATSDKS
jgi:hypothetical protein